MHRFIVVLTVVLLVSGCGGGEGEQQSASGQSGQAPATTTGREAIPDIPPQAEVTQGVSLMVYLDEAGTMTEATVAPGEELKLYVYAEIEGHHHVSAAQFALSMPEGVEVTNEIKFSPRALTVGKLSDLYAMAFECHESGRFLLLTLECRTGETFPGGEFTVRAGVDAQGNAFLGFVTCGEGEPQKLPASGGAVTLGLE